MISLAGIPSRAGAAGPTNASMSSPGGRWGTLTDERDRQTLISGSKTGRESMPGHRRALKLPVIICGQFVIDRSPEQAAMPRFALRHLRAGSACPNAERPLGRAASDRPNERDDADPADSVPAVGQKAARTRERKRSPIAIRAMRSIKRSIKLTFVDMLMSLPRYRELLPACGDPTPPGSPLPRPLELKHHSTDRFPAPILSHE
jgi:hypothetical protein